MNKLLCPQIREIIAAALAEGQNLKAVCHLYGLTLKDFEARPAGNVTGRLSLNVLGHVPENPVDEIFYENRGRTVTVPSAGAPVQLAGQERVKVYSASVQWAHDWFDLDGFYRSGHYHWGYEGDFFGLYREANYGPNIDVYNGEAPLGLEISGKRALGEIFAQGTEGVVSRTPGIGGFVEFADAAVVVVAAT